MAGRKNIPGIANSIADKFISRYNDIEGFWAMGQLYKQAQEEGVLVLRIDLLSLASTPSFKDATELLSRYRNYLYEQLAKQGLERSFVGEVVIELEFGIGESDFLETQNCTCRVSITDDRGRIHAANRSFRCWPHDPKREHRSARE